MLPDMPMLACLHAYMGIQVSDIHTHTAHPVAGAELPNSIVSGFEYEVDTKECYKNADRSMSRVRTGRQ